MDIIMNRLNIDKYRSNKNPLSHLYFNYLNSKLIKTTKDVVEETNIYELLIGYINTLEKLNRIGVITIPDIKFSATNYEWYSLKFTEGSINLTVDVIYKEKCIHITRLEKENGKTICKMFSLDNYTGYNTDMDKSKKSTEELIRKHIEKTLSYILKELKV